MKQLETPLVRVWSEFEPFEELVRPHVVGLFKAHGAGLNVAFHHDRTSDDLKRLLGAYAEAGVKVALWVLLPKDEGYFPNERNHYKFKLRLDEVLDMVEKERLPFPDIAVDLEPPLDEMKLGMSKDWGDRRKFHRRLKANVNPIAFEAAAGEFTKINDAIHKRGAKSLVAASITVADDLRRGDLFTQDLLETPVTNVPWDCISVMWYVSMMTGYSKGLIPYNIARWHLYRDMKTLVERLGPDRASVSLGVTWTGVIGDEPHYDKPSDMIPDVEAAKAAGVKNIWIYNLEGILKAKRPDEWFEVLSDTPAKKPDERFAEKASNVVRSALIAGLRLVY